MAGLSQLVDHPILRVSENHKNLRATAHQLFGQPSELPPAIGRTRNISRVWAIESLERWIEVWPEFLHSESPNHPSMGTTCNDMKPKKTWNSTTWSQVSWIFCSALESGWNWIHLNSFHLKRGCLVANEWNPMHSSRLGSWIMPKVHACHLNDKNDMATWPRKSTISVCHPQISTCHCHVAVVAGLLMTKPMLASAAETKLSTHSGWSSHRLIGNPYNGHII